MIIFYFKLISGSMCTSPSSVVMLSALTLLCAGGLGGSPEAPKPPVSCQAAQKALLLEGKVRNRKLELKSTESFLAGAVPQGTSCKSRHLGW